MNIYKYWEKIQNHLIVMAVIFLLLGFSKFLFGESISEMMSVLYVLNTVSVTVSCVALSIKRGFLWYYPCVLIFLSLMVNMTFFSDDYPAFVRVLLFNNLSASVVGSAMGGIIRKIRENNREEDE